MADGTGQAMRAAPAGGSGGAPPSPPAPEADGPRLDVRWGAILAITAHPFAGTGAKVAIVRRRPQGPQISAPFRSGHDPLPGAGVAR